MSREARLHRLYSRMTRVGRGMLQHILPSGWVACGLIILFFSVGANPTRSHIYQIFALLGAFLLVGVLSLLGFRPKGKATRRTAPTCVPGTPIDLVVHVTNVGRRPWRNVRIMERGPFPVPTLQQFESTPEPSERRRNPFDRVFIFYRFSWLGEWQLTFRTAESEAFDLAPGASRDVSLTLMPLRRGHMDLRHLKLVRQDAFGLFRRLSPLPAPPLRLPVVPPLAHRQFDSTQGAASDPHPAGPAPHHRPGISEEFLSLRDYRPGDPLQHIHWASFARAGHPVVREFEDVHRPRTALILDTLLPDQGKAFSLTHAFERCVEAAATFAGAMDSGDTLLELLLVQDKAHRFTGGPGHLHLRRILEILAGVHPTTRADFSCLERLALAHASQCRSALFLSVDWNPTRYEFLTRLRARGLALHVLIIHTKENVPTGLPSWAQAISPEEASLHVAKLSGKIHVTPAA